MGNCCIRLGSSNMVWAGDDDYDDCGGRRAVVDGTAGGVGDGVLVEKQRLLRDDHHDHDHVISGGASSVSSSLSPSKSTREVVKIKITRKELEELVGRAEVQGLSMEQVLASLINGSDHVDHHHHQLQHQRSWRPVLQSIPEVD